MQNRSSLEILRNREYAADGAIELAITQARGSDCSSTGPLTDTTFGPAIRVDWTTECSTGVPRSVGIIPYPQRNVVFSACLDKSPAKCLDADVIIRAQVNFEPQTGTVVKTSVQSWSVKL
jgi:hypothetical protein